MRWEMTVGIFLTILGLIVSIISLSLGALKSWVVDPLINSIDDLKESVDRNNVKAETEHAEFRKWLGKHDVKLTGLDKDVGRLYDERGMKRKDEE
ncbi:MAG: hypothetical protein ABF778_06870 [Liquorilactobacillus hordei]|uniref:hypothetical protein n=1 Tax=Liquorilactobacillus hordei TaxID=468911 RepID=UPI0039E96FA0